MARDFLLNATSATVNDGSAAWSTGQLGDGTAASSGTVYYSNGLSIWPFASNGTHSTLWMRFNLAPSTTSGTPTSNAVNGFQFAVQGSRDGATWTTISAMPKDNIAFRNHNTMLPAMATNSATASVAHGSTNQTTGALVVGSAAIPGCPLLAINDVVYTSAASGFLANTPYYVVQSTPTGFGTSSAPRSTVQLSLQPNGAPVLATAVTALTVTRFTSTTPMAVGDLFTIQNTVAAMTGTDGVGGAAITLVANNIVQITGVQDTGQAMSFTFKRVGPSIPADVMANNYVHTSATAMSAVVFTSINPTGGEYYLPIQPQVGFINSSGALEDNYKFVRGIAACQINAITPTARLTVDLVTSRDGAYS
jgi:hypothetical protein